MLDGKEQILVKVPQSVTALLNCLPGGILQTQKVIFLPCPHSSTVLDMHEINSIYLLRVLRRLLPLYKE